MTTEANAQERTPRMERMSSCLICETPRPDARNVAYFQQSSKVFDMFVCGGCGYVAIPDNTFVFTDSTSFEKPVMGDADTYETPPRVGTDERPGREYRMIQMGAEIIGAKGLRVLVYGAGASKDFVHAEGLAAVAQVSVTDMVDVHGSDAFIALDDLAGRTFDCIVASEVIEHFVDPRSDFRSLLSLASEDGLVICSTNIYDGGRLERQEYPFHIGHVSYYSPEAIERIARENGFLFDFRVPRIATTWAGPRKRYVLFARSPAVYQRIARYFGSHPFAPAETET